MSDPGRAELPAAQEGAWWRPDLRGWWIGVLFAIGSACFAVASIAAQLHPASGAWIGVTYFVGSLFFTSAAWLQLQEATHGVDRTAAAIQFAGTLAFNVSTFLAMQKGLDTQQTNRRVWAPDAVGSVCFLVASQLAYAEVRGRRLGVADRPLGWWVATLNYIGSVAFGISAVAALVEPSTNEPVSAAIANSGTAVGALCFLAGGILLLPDLRRPAPAS